jgi:ubiquinone/menaquinone biosynthesis C-methylase UbiE
VYFKSKIDKRMSKVKAIFDLKRLLKINPSKNYIMKYYAISRIFYSFFHNSDFTHMGISRHGHRKKDDLLEAARFIEQNIKNSINCKVLELATGRGGNSLYLAKKYPKFGFYGIDISKEQLNYAFKKNKTVTNYYPSIGDFHNLSQFQDDSFDLVFVIESLCHSTNKEKVLNEVRRVLKNGGKFIIIDGYLNTLNTTKNEKTAIKLTAIGMALKKLEYYDSFVKNALKNKFKVISEENVIDFVLPTMEWFEFLAKCFFYYAWLGKLILKTFPNEFVYNAFPGYFLAELSKKKIFSYMITVLKK